MKNYLKYTKDDVRSGLVVSLVAIPLCLGISLASGAPLLSGLIAGIIGGLVVGSMSNSHISVSGPAAGLAVIVYNGIQEVGDFNVFLMAVTLAGVIQISLGAIKAGILSDFIPNSVIKGMLAAIGILIAWKQLPYVFGTNAAENTQTFMGMTYQSGAAVIGFISLAFMITVQKTKLGSLKIFKVLPAVLFVVVIATLVSELFLGLDQSLLVNIGDITGPSDFAASLTMPHWASISNPIVWKLAFVIAIVASIETLLCIEASDKLDPQKRETSTNRELFAQGAGNILSGLIGGLPITSVVVRSTVNASSGGKTKMAAVYHGAFLLFSAMAIPMILNKVPLAVLAVILVMTGFKLNPISLYQDMFKKGHQQFVPFMATIIGVVATDLLSGVVIGMAVSAFMVLKENYIVQNQSIRSDLSTASKDDIVTITLAEHNSFLTRGVLKQLLNSVEDGKQIVITSHRTISIDHDVLEVIDQFVIEAKVKNINIKLEGPHFKFDAENKLRLVPKVA